ncbi:hypothetical protein IDJ81_06150 [Tsuneonella flava]|uniref:Uncharacterized protein n=1 Tax=Tsuneonella flava TaxID=2055955 RepID=A0ABX7KEF8_9SPHN|nr:hypothetical protein [Tsuneonella flava]QSB45686.1 hypothetical protein IDJ81_06150 [Tsuneonella flava]
MAGRLLAALVGDDDKMDGPFGPAPIVRLLGALPPAPFGAASAQLPSRLRRSVQPVPREATRSGCTPGLADGQGFSAALPAARKPKPRKEKP